MYELYNFLKDRFFSYFCLNRNKYPNKSSKCKICIYYKEDDCFVSFVNNRVMETDIPIHEILQYRSNDEI